MMPVLKQALRRRRFTVAPLLLVVGVSCSDGGTQPSTVGSVEVTASAPSLAVYRTVQLTVTLKDRGGKTVTGHTITWSTGNAAVATVSNGLVTGVSAGSVAITATSLGRSGTLTLDVGPAAVDTVHVIPDTATIIQGATRALNVTLKDERGLPLTGRSITWTSDSTNVATVAAGVVTALNAGTARIVSLVEGRADTATVTVHDTVASVVVAPNPVTVTPGDTALLTATVRNAAGAALTGRVIEWTTSQPTVATVSSNGRIFGVADGTATITATSSGKSGTAAVTVAAATGPAVASVTPATLVPGGTATITGSRFHSNEANNVVTIGGVTAVVTAASTTQLQVTVPCIPSGNVPVVVSVGGSASAAVSRPLQVTSQHSLAVGASVVITDGARIPCNELAATGVQSRYVMAVYSTGTSPGAAVDYQLSGMTSTAGANVAAFASGRAARTAQRRAVVQPFQTAQFGDPTQPSHDAAHHQVLEKNQVAYRQLWQRYGRTERSSASPDASQVAAGVPPLTRTIRVSDIDGSNICTTFFTINATRVYYSGKLAIYEDDATPAGLKAANNPTMAAYYQQIGDQFNADMEPIINANYGDVLRRDAVTDNDGVLNAVFTPVINNQMTNIAGFVVSCDQFPNAADNTASNYGEFFYAHLPTVVGTGYASFTPDAWYRSIRATFIHETKHVASFAARVANNSPVWEESWLEEGTARHSEELWARQAVYGVAWKGNTGYGSAASPGSIYCDVRPAVSACTASNPRRPATAMFRHFSSLYAFLGNSSALSPFGKSASDDGSYFYAISWSLVRYAIDRYATTESSFLTGLTQSTTNGTANLSARSGVTNAELVGRWALALYADDRAGLGSRVDLQLASWDVPGIYAGLKTDFASSYPRSVPLVTTTVSFGTIAPTNYTGLVGGGIDYFELAGVHSAAQVMRVQSTTGGAPSSTLRIALLRVQ
jgi:uncharacterized protein YjdB